MFMSPQIDIPATVHPHAIRHRPQLNAALTERNQKIAKQPFSFRLFLFATDTDHCNGQCFVDKQSKVIVVMSPADLLT